LERGKRVKFASTYRLSLTDTKAQPRTMCFSRGRFAQATRSAVQEGIVVGGGVALVQAAKKLAGLTGANNDQDVGISIVRKAIEAPLRQIAENAGVDGAVVAGKIRESDDLTFGFNAQTEEYGDMFAFGVIDPAKVVRTALQDAASVASLLITTEAMVADRPSKDGGAPAMPDMGGMGGMM
jgi:chaperonin GroEL